MICKHFVAGKQTCGSHDPDQKKKKISAYQLKRYYCKTKA